MANNFKPWVDTPTAGQQVQSASVFASDAQRVDGFKAGDPASALRVNSALRQANIVIAGLMQFCDEVKTLPNDLSLLSTVTQVKNAIKASIDTLHNTTLTSAKNYTNTRETAIDTKITNVQNQVTTNKNDISTLVGRVDEHDDEIAGTSTLTTRVETLEDSKINIADIQNVQSTLTNKVPSSKLLKESSFARVYREATEIPGITYPVVIGDLVKAIIDGNMLNCYFCIGMSTATETKVTGLPVIGTTPQSYGTLTIITGSTSAVRMRIEYNREVGNDSTLMWIGSINRATTPYTVDWKQVIDDSSAQTISAIKTFSVSPLVPLTPSGPSAAVSKSYTDSVGFARVYREADEIPGITYPVAINVLVKAMCDQNLYNSILTVGLSNADETKITGLPQIGTAPQTFGILTIQVPGTDAKRVKIEYNREIGDGNAIKWIGALNRVGEWSVLWKMIIDDSLLPYDKIIKTQAEFNALINSNNWLGAKSVALVGQFKLDTSNNGGVRIPAAVKQIHGFNGAKITITNFKYDLSTGKGGLWYDTTPTTEDYSIRDLEVSCTATNGDGHGFRNCNNLSNCTGTGMATNGDGFGFYYCRNLSNCTGKGTATVGYGNGYGFGNCNNLSNCTGRGTGTYSYGFFHINYAVNCKYSGSGTSMWGGTNKNIDLNTCRRTLVETDISALNA